jgi:hypothetical protein
VATALRGWLPKVLAGKVTPFVSSEDIEKGARGLSVIAAELEASRFGVVVITPNNQNSPWVNFEAGALGKSLKDGRVVPLLVGMTDAEVAGPLKQFQNAASADRDAVLALVHSLNAALDESLPRDAVDTLFSAHWDALDTDIREALAALPESKDPSRSSDDILDEVLTTVRALQRDVAVLRNSVMHDRDSSRRRRADREGGQEIEDVLAEILFSSGAKSFTYSSTAHNASVALEPDAPKLSLHTVKSIQDLAASRQMGIRIARHDGSWIYFNPLGVETRGFEGESTDNE